MRRTPLPAQDSDVWVKIESERIHLYWGEVSAAEPSGAGGGLVEEGEDTEVVVLPFQAAMDMIASGEIDDGKTIVALQYLALRKAGQE